MQDSFSNDVDIEALFSGVVNSTSNGMPSASQTDLDPVLLGEMLLDDEGALDKRNTSKDKKKKGRLVKRLFESSDSSLPDAPEVVSVPSTQETEKQHLDNGKLVDRNSLHGDDDDDADENEVVNESKLAVNHLQRVLLTSAESEDTPVRRLQSNADTSALSSDGALVLISPQSELQDERNDKCSRRNTEPSGSDMITDKAIKEFNLANKLLVTTNLENTSVFPKKELPKAKVALSDIDKDILDSVYKQSMTLPPPCLHTMRSDILSMEHPSSEIFGSIPKGYDKNIIQDVDLKSSNSNVGDVNGMVGLFTPDLNDSMINECSPKDGGETLNANVQTELALATDEKVTSTPVLSQATGAPPRSMPDDPDVEDFASAIAALHQTTTNVSCVSAASNDLWSTQHEATQNTSLLKAKIQAPTCRSEPSSVSPDKGTIVIDEAPSQHVATSHQLEPKKSVPHNEAANDNKTPMPFIGEAVSFFAMKHIISLVREIGACLSSGEDIETRWQDVLRLEARTQRYIDEAVRFNFETEDLSAYKTALPRMLSTTGLVSHKSPCAIKGNTVIESSSQKTARSYTTTKQIAEFQMFINKNMLDQRFINRNNTSDPTTKDNKNLCKVSTASSFASGTSGSSVVMCRNDSAESAESYPGDNALPVVRTFHDIKNQMDANSHLNGINKASNSKSKETQPERAYVDETDEDMFIFDEDSSDELGDISKLSDHLSFARKEYMHMINTNAIPGMDLRVPRDVLDQYNHLFNDEYEFSSKVNYMNESVFGYKGFRGVQLAAINAVLLGNDCFLMMATGGGKSHCYQLPSLILGGIVVVFSPLLSLMEDQVRALKQYGIRADVVNGDATSADIKNISKQYLNQDDVTKNGAVLFITPEKFDKSVLTARLIDDLGIAGRLKLFVIDEAHCVSQWGLSFRKDYRKLCNLKTKFPSVPILAMTATATPEVALDIMNVLRINGCAKLRTTINRPNLWIECREKTKDYVKEMIEILLTTTGCGIVYTLTIGDCQKVAQELQKSGISVGTYHAKIDSNQRKQIQKQWTAGEIRVMVATIAFGMGIDKPDVRFVFHTSAPVTILGYYQEIGRAGRDGKFSTTILWYNLRDFERHKNLGQKAASTNQMITGEELAENPSLENMREYCQNKSTCRRLLLFRAFGEDPTEILPGNCRGCDNCCLNVVSEKVDATEDALVICKFVDDVMQFRRNGILTMNMICDSLRGSYRSLICKYRLHQNKFHGVMKERKSKYISQVVQEMVNLNVLRENRRSCRSFGRTVYVLGPNYRKLLANRLRVTIISYKPINSTSASARDTDSVGGSDGCSLINDNVDIEPDDIPEKSHRASKKRPREGDKCNQPSIKELVAMCDVSASQQGKGIGASKIVQALKDANYMIRSDSESEDDFGTWPNLDAEPVNHSIPSVRDIVTTISKQPPPAKTSADGHKNDVLIIAHKVIPRAVKSASAGNITDCSSNSSTYNTQSSTTPNERGNSILAIPSKQITPPDGFLGGKSAPPNNATPAIVPIAKGTSKPAFSLEARKENPTVDVQVARQNNIRRKVPKDLLGVPM